ncbi:MAG: hypothetical protein K6B68_13605 [Eubacterium sp.]|nr:hypothetical protein [Eubacterium sp.]
MNINSDTIQSTISNNIQNANTDNQEKIIWFSSHEEDERLNGFYMDFSHQLIGYKDFSEHLEYRKMFLLEYMYDNKSIYINSVQTEQLEQLNSINLPKYISNIKSKIINILSNYYDMSECEELFSKIIDKNKIHGKLGYKLNSDFSENTRYSNTQNSDANNFETQDSKNNYFDIQPDVADSVEEDHHDISNSESVTSASSRSIVEEITTYFKNNWLPLFILFYGGIMIVLFFMSEKISLGELFNVLLDTPMHQILFIFLSISMLPIILGIIIDTPIAFYTSKISDKKLREVLFRPNERFDASPIHIFFFSMCNLTGALSAVSMIFFVKGAKGYHDYLLLPSHRIPFALIMCGSLITSLYNNFSLQTKVHPARNNRNYLLNRFHTFFNTINLFVLISISCCMMYAFLAMSFRSGIKSAGRPDASFIILMMSLYAYLWFSAESPMAKKLDSVSRFNFLSGVPVLSIMSIIYIIFAFDGSINCILTIIITLTIFVFWLFDSMQQKKADTLNVRKVSTSFFSIIAFISIIMIIKTSINF